MATFRCTLQGANSLSFEVNESVPTISQLEILDGSDTTYANGEVMQYVNLPSDEKFVDGNDICNLDRLGRNIRVKVVFDLPGVHEFQIELVPDANNIKYSATEKSKNENYKYEEQALSFETDENGEKIIDGKQLYIDVAGNNIYKIKAKDCSNAEMITSASIKTMRMLYYSEVRMQGLTSALPTAQLANVEAEYLKYGIKLVRLNTYSIPLMENIDTRQEENTFFRSVAAAVYNDKLAKMPCYFTIAYTGHLAKKKVLPIKDKTFVHVGPNQGPVTIPVSNGSYIFPLWYNITSSDTWYVNCYFLPTGKTDVTANRITIPKTKIKPIQLNGTKKCENVEIDVSFLPAGTGAILLEVYCCEGMRGGFGKDGGDIVTICTKADWKPLGYSDQIKAVIHEMGHMLGMASDGKKRDLDVVPTYYNNSNAPGHIGDHCCSGITSGAPYDSVSAKSQANCVMYGAINNSLSFCSECTKRVRKTFVTI